MSIDLGHSRSYIQSISSGRALPSMSEFLYICDYFNITPVDFFDTQSHETLLVQELNDLSKNLSKDDLNILIQLSKRFSTN